MHKFSQKIPFEFILIAVIALSSLSAIAINNIYAPLLMLIPCGLLMWKFDFFKGIFAALGVILLTLTAFIRSQTAENSLQKQLNNRPLYGRIRFEITDPLCCSLPYIRQRTAVQIKICEITDLLGTKYYGKGNFFLYAKDMLPSNAMYGDIFETTGTLRFAEAVQAWDIDDETAVSDYRFGNFHRFMEIHEIDGMFSPDKKNPLTAVGKNDSFFRKMLLWRDKTLNYIVSGMRDPENRAVIAAMFFGLKGAVDAGDKENFIKSGTIHLFSVSGLHVGILFAILLPLLTFVPVKWRYLCATVLLIPFMLTTGINIPSVRAFLVILFFSLLRCCCFTIPPLRLLALCGSIFLIWQYKYLCDAGFLYSFGITAILLMVSENTVKWNKIWNTHNNLKAANRKNPANHSRLLFFLRKAVFALTSTLAAFAFGSIITLFVFGYLYFSAIWINFFIIFYSPVLIYLFLIQIIPTPYNTGGIIFEQAVSFMRSVIEFGANYPLQCNTTQISIFASVIFYIILLSLLYIRNKKYFVFAATFLLFFFPLNTLFCRLQKSELLVIYEPIGNESAFVLADVPGNYAWAFNINSPQSIELARKFLAAKGINHINSWIMYGNTKNKLKSLENGMKNMKIQKIVHISRSDLPFEDDFKSQMFYQRINSPYSEWTVKDNLTNFFRKKSQIGFEYFNPQTILPLCVIFDSGKHELSFRQNDKTKIVKYINSNILEYSVYEL